jgi:hypothetical protein
MLTLMEIDARFDVVGAPYSLLSVSLSASQNLYTRRGTLVGLSGKADNVGNATILLSKRIIFANALIPGGFDIERSRTFPQGYRGSALPLPEGI